EQKKVTCEQEKETESSVAKGKDKSRRRHGYKVPLSNNAESFNLQHMGVTLTGILWIKDSQTKWVEMLEECLCSSEGQASALLLPMGRCE
ncbi:hypothetical protein F7725_023935, partial [Dissostichus mawsoni]